MRIHRAIAELRVARQSAGRVALVPTMGNLHEGHIALVREAVQRADQVFVSIFVNRLQFGEHEDFDHYPRTIERDLQMLEEAGAAHVFAPAETEMYSSPQRYYVVPPPEQASILEGAFRAGHFRGVTTVVLKLFNIVLPDVALFGKKDYQQLIILDDMVRELSLPISIVAVETVRAVDGLALSSRNHYLSLAERSEAPRLYRVLDHCRQCVRSGTRNFSELESDAVRELARHGWKPDYVAIRRRKDLLPPVDERESLVVLAAATLGKARLIDNVEI
ncbi:MAG: pantoate--beta-alanine ligase [Burkholderiales bacterium]|jgi:pantoate--beta-alanine ligase|nr:pantoate--beta-alanine ligase [Burkholderiales bacterium]